jgi:hypothetical protein
VFDLSSPTPLASLLSGLLTLAVLAAVYALWLWQWRRSRRHKKRGSVVDRMFIGVRAVDRAIVHAASWVVGTRYEDPWTRRMALVMAFLGFALAGTFLP